MTTRKYNVVNSALHQVPEIGMWLWALEDARARTLEELVQLTPAILDWQPPDGGSSISTLLYHIADIEADWLYAEVLEQPLPPTVLRWFPYPTRDDQGDLTQVQGEPMEVHFERLATIRRFTVDTYRAMDLDEFRRIRSLAYYDVTPEWVLHHLMQHEAEHRSQIAMLLARAAHARVGGSSA